MNTPNYFSFDSLKAAEEIAELLQLPASQVTATMELILTVAAE